MEIVKDFIIIPKDKQIRFTSDYQEKLFRNTLDKLNGQKVRLSITTKELKRSDKQNRLYHLYLSVISKETGHTKEELHAYFKGKYLTERISEVFGQKVRTTKSTTDLSTNDFVEYMMNIENETNVSIPDVEAWRWGDTLQN